MFEKIRNKHLYSYLDYTKQPWGKLFYLSVWNQLPELKGKKILDFGSGFGITADYLSDKNDVTALEPSKDMLSLGNKSEKYKRICGGVNELSQFEDKTFDCIVCHNVLEYVDDRSEILKEFVRVLKDDGVVSIVKHNKAGRIMQKAIFDYDIKSVKIMLNNQNLSSQKFGEIKVYDDNTLTNESDGLYIDKCFGICTFYGLQNNDIKFKKDWIESMLDIELSVSQIDDFRNIAFFHHLMLKKKI